MNKYNVSVIDDYKSGIKKTAIKSSILSMIRSLDRETISKSAIKNLDKKTFSIGIVLCSDDKIKEINNTYRGKNQPTDVITFSLFADNKDMPIDIDIIELGEIFLSIDTVKKQAQEFNRTFEEEFYFLLAHGILHLLGFNHENDEKLDFMINLQNKMVERIIK